MQKKQAEAATRRAVDIFEDESEAFIGDQVSSFAKAGVDLSGSALLKVAGTKAAVGRELQAIKKEGETTATLARMRADNSRAEADRLSSDGLAALTIAGGIFQGAAGVTAFNTSVIPSSRANVLSGASSNPLLSASKFPQLQRPALIGGN